MVWKDVFGFPGGRGLSRDKQNINLVMPWCTFLLGHSLPPVPQALYALMMCLLILQLLHIDQVCSLMPLLLEKYPSLDLTPVVHEVTTYE